MKDLRISLLMEPPGTHVRAWQQLWVVTVTPPSLAVQVEIEGGLWLFVEIVIDRPALPVVPAVVVTGGGGAGVTVWLELQRWSSLVIDLCSPSLLSNLLAEVCMFILVMDLWVGSFPVDLEPSFLLLVSCLSVIPAKFLSTCCLSNNCCCLSRICFQRVCVCSLSFRFL